MTRESQRSSSYTMRVLLVVFSLRLALFCVCGQAFLVRSGQVEGSNHLAACEAARLMRPNTAVPACSAMRARGGTPAAGIRASTGSEAQLPSPCQTMIRLTGE